MGGFKNFMKCMCQSGDVTLGFLNIGL